MAKTEKKKVKKVVETKSKPEKKSEGKKSIKKKAEKKVSSKVEQKKDVKAKKKKVEPEEELEEIDEKEIENFQIEGLDMEKLKTTVLELVSKHEDGIFQSDLWKKLKLSSRDGSRLSLKLERQNLIKREKILDNGRWTYKLKIVHVPVSTQSIESAPCLICPVEQKCTLEGEVSPRTCPLIEQWVLTELASYKKKKK